MKLFDVKLEWFFLTVKLTLLVTKSFLNYGSLSIKLEKKKRRTAKMWLLPWPLPRTDINH